MSSWKLWREKRHIVMFLAFLGVFILYVVRINLSVAIVAMTTDRYKTLENGTIIKHEAEFQWSNVIQGYLLSAFFYGYVITPPFGGIVAKRIGGRNALAVAVVSSSLATLIAPWLAEWSPYALLVSRAFIGLMEGLTFPGIYVLFSKWIPENEKSRAVAQIHAGNYAGTVFSMLVFGYLAEVAGWRSLFWFGGVLGILWSVSWLLLITESPQKHPSISKSELLYIESYVKLSSKKKNQIPWKLLLTSRSIWITILPAISENWGFFTIVSLIPKYFNDVYQFDLSKMGAISALPYVLLAITMMGIGQLYDRIIARKWFSVTVLRKICIGVGLVTEAGFMLGAAFWENVVGNIFCLIISVGSGAISKPAIAALPFDLSPEWSGCIYGMMMSVSALSGIISPVISGYILSDNPTIDSWRTIFYVTVGMQLSGTICFILFGSAEPLNLDSAKSREFD